MQLASPDGVYFCLPGERSIFLDLDRDRYFAASPEATAALLRAIAGTSILGSDEHLLTPLLDQGLLTLEATPSRPVSPTKAAPIRREILAAPAFLPMLTIRALTFQYRVRRRLARRGLADTLARCAQKRVAQARKRSVETILGAAATSDLIYASHERCLLKSVALFELLREAGHAPTLVLGVRDLPFAAHAWVQLGDAVVGDSLERVGLYHPILTI